MNGLTGVAVVLLTLASAAFAHAAGVAKPMSGIALDQNCAGRKERNNSKAGKGGRGMRTLLIVTFLFAFASLSGSPSLSQVSQPGIPAEEEVIGDINGDKKLDIRDVQLSLRVALGLERLTEDKLLQADLRPRSPWGGPLGDGKITLADTTAHLLLALGLIKVEPSWEVVIEKEKAIPMENASIGNMGLFYFIDDKFWVGGLIWDKEGRYLGAIHEVYGIPPRSDGYSWLYGVDKYNNPIIQQDDPQGTSIYIFYPETKNEINYPALVGDTTL